MNGWRRMKPRISLGCSLVAFEDAMHFDHTRLRSYERSGNASNSARCNGELVLWRTYYLRRYLFCWQCSGLAQRKSRFTEHDYHVA